MDRELNALLAGVHGPYETRFRLKVREILNDELATFRADLKVNMKKELDAFRGALQTELTDILTKSSMAAAKNVKSYIDRELLPTYPPTPTMTHHLTHNALAG